MQPAGYTPTPVVSHAILTYNCGRARAWPMASRSRPRTIPRTMAASNTIPPQGGPADTQVTKWIEHAANAFLADGLKGVVRVPFERARQASTTHPHRFLAHLCQ